MKFYHYWKFSFLWTKILLKISCQKIWEGLFPRLDSWNTPKLPNCQVLPRQVSSNNSFSTGPFKNYSSRIFTLKWVQKEFESSVWLLRKEERFTDKKKKWNASPSDRKEREKLRLLYLVSYPDRVQDTILRKVN